MQPDVPRPAPTHPTTAPIPTGSAHGSRTSLGRWVRENFFSTWYNTLLTAVSLWLLYILATTSVRWLLGSARWEVIPANITPLLIGTYPRSQVWRIWLILISLALLSGLTAGVGRSAGRRVAGSAAAISVFALFPVSASSRVAILGAAVLFVAGYRLAKGRTRLRPWLTLAWFFSFPWTMFWLWGIQGSQMLPRVETSAWGGLALTLVLAVVGIVASLPIGIVLALGRQSSLPVISWFCTAFIELVRGTPLVTILFMAHLMVPIFLPDLRIDKVVRAMIGLTIFTSAYMAENVRGGLQGVGKGQYEAAKALGMNGTLMMLLVVLPQALRAVIPSIVGQFISLFKDTSLVAIIGLLDLLGVARSVIANPRWLGLQAEVFLFAALVYWLFSYTLSRSSRRVEETLGVARRR